MEGQAGFQCVLSIGGVTVGIAKDVTPTLGRASVDDTTRGDAGWKAWVAGLGEWGCSFNMRYEPTNSELQALETALLDGTEVALFQMVDQEAYGWVGTVLVEQFERSEPVGGAVDVAITVKGQGAPTQVSAGT